MFTIIQLTSLKKRYKITSDNSAGNGEIRQICQPAYFRTTKIYEADQQQRDIFMLRKLSALIRNKESVKKCRLHNGQIAF